MTKRRFSPQTSKFRTIRASYRSGLEATIATALALAKVPAEFECMKVPYTQPEKARYYTPDFLLPNDILIETKGMFTLEDRQKHVWIKAQHPKLDIRFVFSNAKAKLSKESPTTYSMWADKQGFKWSHKTIPAEWLTEPSCPVRKAAVAALRSG